MNFEFVSLQFSARGDVRAVLFLSGLVVALAAGCAGGAGEDDDGNADDNGSGPNTTAGTETDATGGTDADTGSVTGGEDTSFVTTADDSGTGTPTAGETDSAETDGPSDADAAPDATLQVVDEAGAARTLTNVTTVPLQIDIASGRLGSVLVANDAALKANAKTYRVADLIRVDADSLALPDLWNLNGGLDSTAASTDGPRSVFARFTSDRGAESAIVRVTVTLDRRAPSAEITVTGSRLNKSGTIDLVVAFDEALVAAPEVSIAQRSGAPVMLSAPTVSGNVYTFKVTAAIAVTDGLWSVSGQAADRAGNTRELLAEELFAVDTVAPVAPSAVTFAAPAVAVDGRFYAKTGTPISVSLGVGAAVDFDPSSSAVGIGPLALSPSADGRVWSGTTPAQIPEQSFPVVLRLVDNFGNETAVTATGASLIYDLTAPSLVEGLASISITPPSGSTVATVNAITTGATVSVELQTTEPTLAPPTSIIASKDTTEIELDVAPSSGTTVTATTTLNDANPAQGTYTVTAGLTDFAGNFQSVPVTFAGDGFVVDTVAPAAPVANTPARLVMLNVAPWGSLATGGVPRVSVYGSAGAAAAGSVLVFFKDGTTEVGRTAALADGSFGEIVLNVTSTQIGALSVRAYDGAGNASATASKVGWFNWISTLGGKKVGSTAENPHTFIAAYNASSATLPVASSRVTLSQSDFDELASLGAGLTQSGALALWETATPATVPSTRAGYGMAYDSATGYTYMYGGLRANGTCGLVGTTTCSETWRWFGGSNWILDSAVSGIGRHSFQMAYDSVRSRTVAFGGIDSTATSIATTSEWNGSVWSNVSAATAPTARNSAAMAYDPVRRRTVLFGGVTSSTALGDTWEYNGTTWMRVATTGPAARWGAGMAYDAARGRIVLFGGYTSATGSYFNDTWEWNGSSWTLLNLASAPTGRARMAFAYDPVRQTEFIFGGDTGTGGGSSNIFTNEIYMRFGSAWQRVLPSGTTVPAVRASHAMVYDSLRNVFVTYGGNSPTFGSYVSDTQILSTGAATAPTHTIGVARAPEPAATVYGLSARWYAGGVGFPNGTITPGVQLQYFDQNANAWKNAASNSASTDFAQELVWSTSDTAVISAIRPAAVATFPTMYFRARPVADGGKGLAGDLGNQVGKIVSDYVEVTVTGQLN